MGASLATKIVYHEGLSFLEQLDDDQLSRVAFAYMAEEARVGALATAMEDAACVDPAVRAEVAAMLRWGGVRTALESSGTVQA